MSSCPTWTSIGVRMSGCVAWTAIITVSPRFPPTRRSTCGPIGSRPRVRPAPIQTCCSARRWTASTRASPSATCCTARQAIFSEDLSAAFCRAINDWVAAEWLDATAAARLHRRADAQPGARRREIERKAADQRFVQVLVWEMGELPLGRRQPLADLSRRGTIRFADRHPCRQQLSPSTDQSRLAVVLPGGLRRPGPPGSPAC